MHNHWQAEQEVDRQLAQLIETVSRVNAVNR
jgi:hypothetical protein